MSQAFQEVTSRFRTYLAMGHEALNQVIDEVPPVLSASPMLNVEVFSLVMICMPTNNDPPY